MDYNKASMELHAKYHGKISTGVPFLIDSPEMLAAAYTPGVAKPCREIARNPESVWDLTIKGRTVAVITDGSAVLGLGNIGPEAALPVMEGKAALFKQLANVDAFPICLATQNVDEIVETVIRIAPVFGGINLEDIAAPACFEVERRLIEALDLPVMHDDQHGTATVILAGLINAARVVGKEIKDLHVLINGAGAAGLAAAHLLHGVGVASIAVVDSRGVVVEGRDNLNTYKQEVVDYNTDHVAGTLAEAIRGQDVFIGVSAPNVLTREMVATMAKDAIVFAMANPDPEILPEEARAGGAAVVATGRSDFANQINNALVFPGMFKGALSVRARLFTTEMKVAAAHALADMIQNPTAEHIVPSPLDPGVAEKVAEAVASAVK
ncbi:NAD-dependent malic enzyme [Candidatus Uhrbacteria bacterium CG10_big_fil_rev_8_21_14_0_10_50_16]|uniref:NAD-dependent malic enzyme n=1 Tax=Candidatus Uhrbacteria bacterium CG10_big_fil_rev_8_21_14_0_10_50_16 TaxID=1975039 RepID=A0A2H0RMJ4_9BACT|nr:MAG: NAD-dependent malic enzyme [Candidatus Uhrbacteria bacterium CG10_big_fil_rev_8_21_14_0_10_50_16]